MTVSDLLEQPCNKSDNAIKLVTSVDNLFQTCYNKLGTSSANTTCSQLVNRLVTTCLQTCNNLCVFTRVGGIFSAQRNFSLFVSSRAELMAKRQRKIALSAENFALWKIAFNEDKLRIT